MEPQKVPTDTPHELANDILRGADEIAEFIFGERGSRRKVYYLTRLRLRPTRRGCVFVGGRLFRRSEAEPC
jgi:hypothetical protein